MSTMVHPLVTIEETASAQQNAPAALKVASPVHAIATGLVEMFTNETEDDTKVKQIVASATVYTCEEYAQGIAQAKKIADAMDSANGFISLPKGETKKTSDYYGPKRLLLNSRMGEAKRIFGVAKLAPDVLKEKGYWKALSAAKTWLTANGKTWDGKKAETAEDKAKRAKDAIRIGARAQVMNQNPQQDSEDDLEYFKRINELMKTALDSAESDAFDKRVARVTESLRKQFGAEMDVLRAACESILAPEQTDDTETAQPIA